IAPVMIGEDVVAYELSRKLLEAGISVPPAVYPAVYDPNRFWDVAIAEQHAVTSMATMAKEGFIPFVAIYSTFLQRAFDQIIHDVSIMNMPVRFAIDRAGIVGEDGETHQGLLDIAYLRAIPNMILFAPRDNTSLCKAIEFAIACDHAPSAFRYPRNAFMLPDNTFAQNEFSLGKAEILQSGKEILLIGYGNGVGRAWKCAKILEDDGLMPTLLDLRFVKPLDTQLLAQLLSTHKHAFVFSDTYYLGGVASAIIESLIQTPAKEHVSKITSFEVRDMFVPHGKSEIVEHSLGLDAQTLAQTILNHIA
ncbi:MAG: hypothetical protein IJ950_01005, partial [Helicobacter sp.]|nr:hypothetical protein [Helicobacter sp.]